MLIAHSSARARSGSMAAPEPSPGLQRPSTMHFPSTSPIEEAHFPMLSEAEEAEMDKARSGFRDGHDDGHSDHGAGYGAGDRDGDSHDGDDGDEGDEGLVIRSGRGGGGESGSVGGSSGYDSHTRLLDRGGGGHGRGEDGGRVHSHEQPRSFGRRGGEGHGFENGRQQAPQGFARNTFDFAAMEDYAKDHTLDNGGPAWIPGSGRGVNGEGIRRRSGNGGGGNGQGNDGRGIGASDENLDQVQPQVSASYSTTMDRTMTMSAYGDADDHDGDHDRDHDHDHDHERDGTFSPRGQGDHFKRRRQRKLSQSNSAVRRPGKLAIFEGFGSASIQAPTIEPDGGPSTTALKAPRQPKNLKSGQPDGGGGFQPFTDAPPGHDRPYRFSFYSNALPVTIHARSLAELPAEGQTFEDLFKGKNNGETKAEAAADGVGTEYGSFGTATGPMGPRRAGVDSPVINEEGGPSVSGVGNGKLSLLARVAGAAVKESELQNGGGAEEDPEAFTWWLDVLSPTDEEMRMLSKVCTASLMRLC
jgi:magnesium transporter